MIRILQVVNIMDRAGLETMLMNYYRNIDRSQIQFDFLTHRDIPGAYEEEIKKMGGLIYRAPRLYPQNYPAYFSFMADFFHNHSEYRIVHSHIDTMSVFPLYAAKKSGIPYRIGHSHSSKLDRDIKLPIKYVAKLLMPKEANVYCACSKVAAQFMYAGKKVKIIHNAIDLRHFQYDESKRNLVREKLGVTNKFVVGHVGRFYYVKNQTFLLDIIQEIKKIDSDIRLLLIGKGEDEPILKKKVEKLGLKENVIFLIDRSDVNELYQAMDVFVMPSIFEGLPVVGVEAQANGLPCLFSNKISGEVVLTNTAKQIGLEETANVWAENIMKMRNGRNIEAQRQLREQGYDISLEANKLAKWYMELNNN